MEQLINVEEKAQDFLSDVTTDVDLLQGDATSITLWIRSYLQEVNNLHKEKIEEITEAVASMKLQGQFLHSGDIYNPEDINAYLDEIIELLKK